MLDLREEGRHTRQVCDRRELLVDGVVRADGRQLAQVLEICRVAAATVPSAQRSFTFF